MYINAKRIDAINTKNILISAIAIAGLVTSVSWELFLVIRYQGDPFIILHAAATPSFFFWIIVGPLMLINAGISTANIGDARFYANYFEINPNRYIPIAELAEAIGKRETSVKSQLLLFSNLYMGNYLVTEDTVELAYKAANSKYINPGAIEKEYRVPSGGKENALKGAWSKKAVREETGIPQYYTADNLENLRAVYPALAVISVIVILIMAHGIMQALSNFDNKEYYRAIILDVNKHMQSRELIRYHLIEIIITNAFVIFGAIPVLFYAIGRIRYAKVADACAKYFAKSNMQTVKLADLPTAHSAGNKKKQKLVRAAIRKGYLKHCTLKMHYGELEVFLPEKTEKTKIQAAVSAELDRKAEAYRKNAADREEAPTETGVHKGTESPKMREVVDAQSDEQSDTQSSDKAKIMCVIMVFVFSIICFLASAWQYSIYTSLRDHCTAEIVGVVDQANKGRISGDDPVATRYLSNEKNRTKLHIKIEPDGVFNRKRIYANPESNEEVGSEVIIHYSPDDPDLYYLNEHFTYYRDAAIIVFGIGIASLIGTFLLAGYVKRKSKSENKRRN